MRTQESQESGDTGRESLDKLFHGNTGLRLRIYGIVITEVDCSEGRGWSYQNHYGNIPLARHLRGTRGVSSCNDRAKGPQETLLCQPIKLTCFLRFTARPCDIKAWSD